MTILDSSELLAQLPSELHADITHMVSELPDLFDQRRLAEMDAHLAGRVVASSSFIQRQAVRFPEISEKLLQGVGCLLYTSDAADE